MTLPEWVEIFASWMVILGGLSTLLMLSLWLLDRAVTGLLHIIGVYNVVFDALWKHYRNKDR